MILLLAGASETARMLLAEKFLAEHPEWKHLALEDLREDGTWSDEDVDMQDIFGTMVACECAVEEHQRGTSVLVTCPSLELVKTAVDALPDNVTSIYMGAAATGWAFDHQLDTNEHSTNDMHSFLCSLVS